jgi:TPR repeat protein
MLICNLILVSKNNKEDGINLTTRDIQKARENDGETLFNIGCDYRNNKKDDTKAFEWFNKAAFEGYEKA